MLPRVYARDGRTYHRATPTYGPHRLVALRHKHPTKMNIRTIDVFHGLVPNSNMDLMNALAYNDPDFKEWNPPINPNYRCNILLYVRAGLLPDPPTHWKEMVKRMPFLETMVDARKWFYSHCQGYNEYQPAKLPRGEGEKSKSCPLCASNWLGYPVAYHKEKDCPMKELNDDDTHYFVAINSTAYCRFCAGRSMRHTIDRCGNKPCTSCGSKKHRSHLKFCAKEAAGNDVTVVLNNYRKHHYKRMQELANQPEQVLFYRIHTDAPDERLRDYPTSRNIIGGYGYVDDRNNPEFPTIPDDKYTRCSFPLLSSPTMDNPYYPTAYLVVDTTEFTVVELSIRLAIRARREREPSRPDNHRITPPGRIYVRYPRVEQGAPDDRPPYFGDIVEYRPPPIRRPAVADRPPPIGDGQQVIAAPAALSESGASASNSISTRRSHLTSEGSNPGNGEDPLALFRQIVDVPPMPLVTPTLSAAEFRRRRENQMELDRTEKTADPGPEWDTETGRRIQPLWDQFPGGNSVEEERFILHLLQGYFPPTHSHCRGRTTIEKKAIEILARRSEVINDPTALAFRHRSWQWVLTGDSDLYVSITTEKDMHEYLFALEYIGLKLAASQSYLNVFLEDREDAEWDRMMFHPQKFIPNLTIYQKVKRHLLEWMPGLAPIFEYAGEQRPIPESAPNSRESSKEDSDGLYIKRDKAEPIRWYDNHHQLKPRKAFSPVDFDEIVARERASKEAVDIMLTNVGQPLSMRVHIDTQLTNQLLYFRSPSRMTMIDRINTFGYALTGSKTVVDLEKSEEEYYTYFRFLRAMTERIHRGLEGTAELGEKPERPISVEVYTCLSGHTAFRQAATGLALPIPTLSAFSPFDINEWATYTDTVVPHLFARLQAIANDGF